MRPQKLSYHLYLLYTAVIVGGIFLDWLTKRLAVAFLRPVTDVPLIRGVLHLTYVENRGAAFGILSDHRMIFIIFSCVAMFALLLYLYLGGVRDNRLSAVAIAMIIAGGVGNLIERIGQGYVVDFINFELIGFAVFNVADSFICVGAGLLILSMILDLVRENRGKNHDNG